MSNLEDINKTKIKTKSKSICPITFNNSSSIEKIN